MIAWKSMFDSGAITVTVYFGLVTVWFGNLAKGDSSPTFTNVALESDTATYQVSVDANGVVTLSSTAENAGYLPVKTSWRLAVQPLSKDVTGQIRMIGISGWNSGFGGQAFSDDAAQLVNFSNNVGVAIPSSATFTPVNPLDTYMYIALNGSVVV